MSDRVLRPVLREKNDIGPRFMLLLLGGIGLSVVLLLVLAWLLFPHELKDQRFAQPFPQYPAPALQADPPAEMQAFYAREMQQLHSAGWIDKQAGIVHIPIDQAMQAVVKEGIKGWPAPDAGQDNGR
jgi:hypothetical protein